MDNQGWGGGMRWVLVILMAFVLYGVWVMSRATNTKAVARLAGQNAVGVWSGATEGLR